MRKIAKLSKYRSTVHVTPVSSIREHTNSISKHVMSDGSVIIRNADDIEAKA